MILEVAVLHVRSGESGDFERAFAQAQDIISAMPGYVSHQLQRCLESPDKYLLLVQWRTLEDHIFGFRQSPNIKTGNDSCTISTSRSQRWNTMSWCLLPNKSLKKRMTDSQLMSSSTSKDSKTKVTLRPVSRANWRDIAKLEVTAAQREFVAEPCYYLALCHYDNKWQPLAIYLDERVIGFLMWAVDPADGSCWLGGIFVDHSYQRRGYGRQAVQAAIAMLAEERGYQYFALSYQPANIVAKHLYDTLGFTEMDEWEDDEVVARLSLAEQRTR